MSLPRVRRPHRLAKFAPTLKVRTFYGGQSAARQRTLTELRSLDVLITTPHIQLDSHLVRNQGSHSARTRRHCVCVCVCTLLTVACALCSVGQVRNLRVHRLILDEAHLLSGGSSTAQKLNALRRYTPLTTWDSSLARPTCTSPTCMPMHSYL